MKIFANRRNIDSINHAINDRVTSLMSFIVVVVAFLIDPTAIVKVFYACMRVICLCVCVCISIKSNKI